MLNYRGDAVVEWLTMICDLAWRLGEVPGEWRKVVMMPLYIGTDM